MILADTSVWVNHLRNHDPVLASLLYAGEICIHPFVVGEILLGSIRNRTVLTALLTDLPQSEFVPPDEVLQLITSREIFSRGVGYVDAALIASAALTPNTKLWTFDKRLGSLVSELGVAV